MQQSLLYLNIVLQIENAYHYFLIDMETWFLK